MNYLLAIKQLNEVSLSERKGVPVQDYSTKRLYAFLALGLLAVGLSFLSIVVTLTPQSNYVSGLLPTFLVRGLAIPIISSCATLAVVSAVSTKQSGLASGTLGMARNIGTAFGVAVLGQIYLLHINAALPSYLAASRAARSSQRLFSRGSNSPRLPVLSCVPVR